MVLWFMRRLSLVQSDLPTVMNTLIDITVSYRPVSDTALLICDESQINKVCGKAEVETTQPDFDSRIEFRAINTDEQTREDNRIVVGLQIIGAKSRRDSGFFDSQEPGQLFQLISQTIDTVDDDALPHKTWVQRHEIPMSDLVIQIPLHKSVTASLAEVKAVSAALDDFGVAHQSMMLRSVNFSCEPKKLLSSEFRMLWSNLAQEVDQAQGLGPTTAVVRTLNALTLHQVLPLSINEATQRSLKHILQGNRWKGIAETLREATSAINQVESAISESPTSDTPIFDK